MWNILVGFFVFFSVGCKLGKNILRDLLFNMNVEY